jgi:hypothetical protein
VFDGLAENNEPSSEESFSKFFALLFDFLELFILLSFSELMFSLELCVVCFKTAFFF